MTGALSVRGTRDYLGAARDLAVVDGRIAHAAPPDADDLDGAGWVVLPRLADAHVHLDKTLLGEPWPSHRTAATIEQRVQLERQLLDSPGIAPLSVRAARLIELAVARGTTLLQSHVDIDDTTVCIERVEILMSLAETYAAAVDLALVAFPQAGILRKPGTREALDRALKIGAEAIGGLDPETFDGDREGHLDVVFGLAERHGCRVDIHLHEPGEGGARTIRAIAERTRVLGLQGRCAISHGYALAQVDEAELVRTATAMAETRVSLVTSVPGQASLPPLARLRDLGVNVIAASDNIRDSWSPFGSPDQLARAALAAYRSGWSTDEELVDTISLVTAHPAIALGREQAMLRLGEPADFSLVRAESLGDALATPPLDRIVVRQGRVVARAGAIRQPLARPAGAAREASQ